MRHAKSKRKIRAEASAARQDAMETIIAWIRSARVEKGPYDPPPSVDDIIDEVCDAYQIKRIGTRTVYQHLAHPTTRTKAQSAASRRWLNDAEEAALTGYINFHAQGGWGLGRKEIEEAALAIARIRHPHLDHLGVSWFPGYRARAPSMSGFWTKSLDTTRAAALNPITVGHYFDLLERILTHYNLTRDVIYGVDESGFPPGGDEISMRVYGPAGSSVMHHQSEGNRENVTAVVCICADGSYVRPTIIFKGKEASSEWWNADRTLQLDITVSEKGWTNGAICLLWLMQFDRLTKEKANGRWRLIILDGHISHFTVEFVRYAMENQIAILCYPSHTTHALQGLDVVAFSVFKRIWNRMRSAWLRENPRASFGKTAWLKVWSEAYIEAMTESVICASFRATGVVPFDRTVITEEMMRPSASHSSQTSLPDIYQSPVKRVAVFSSAWLHRNDAADDPPPPVEPSQDIHMFSEPEDDDDEPMSSARRREAGSPVPRDRVVDQVRQGGEMLSQALAPSSAAPLLSSLPLPHAFELPELVYGKVLDLPPLDISLIEAPTPPGMSPEAAHGYEKMRQALAIAYERERLSVRAVDATNAGACLSTLMVAKQQYQLANAEERKKKKAKKGFRIKMNGKARLLTHESFPVELEQIENERRREDAGKQARKRLNKGYKKVKKAHKKAHEAWQVERARCIAAKEKAPRAPQLIKRKEWIASAAAAADGSDDSDTDSDEDTDDDEDED